MELAYNQILKRMDLKVEAVNLTAQASQNHENQKPLDVPLDQMHTWVQHSCLLEWSTDPGRRTPASTLIQCISFCIYSHSFVRLPLSQRASHWWWCGTMLNEIVLHMSACRLQEKRPSDLSNKFPVLFRAIPSLGWGTARHQCKTNLISHWHMNKKLPEAKKTTNCKLWEHHTVEYTDQVNTAQPPLVLQVSSSFTHSFCMNQTSGEKLNTTTTAQVQMRSNYQ